MKRTGVQKLELKKLTVKQLSEVSGAGHKIGTRWCSGTCICATTGTCVDVKDEAGYNECDYQALGIAGCDGSCVQPQGGGGGGCGGGGGGGCGGGGERQLVCMV